MHLSSQEEYGLRCLVRLAKHSGEEPLRIGEIAESEGLSAEYVAKLMRVLRKGNIVTSTRGASGGYHLARSAEETSVWDVLEVLGGQFFPESFCQSHPGSLRDCIHTTDCSLRSLWRGVSGLLRNALSAISVADLLNGSEATFGWLSHTPLGTNFGGQGAEAAEGGDKW